MLINLPNVKIKSNTANIRNAIIYSGTEYLVSLPREARLIKLEDKINSYYNTNYDILDLMLKVLENIKVMKTDGHIVISLDKKSKYNNLKLDILEKIITYGARDIQGVPHIREAIVYALNKMG